MSERQVHLATELHAEREGAPCEDTIDAHLYNQIEAKEFADFLRSKGFKVAMLRKSVTVLEDDMADEREEEL